jgi:hypothetical protein
MLKFGMSSRHSHPISCRLPRKERADVVAFARNRGLSLSGLLKVAVRRYISSETAVYPGVHQGALSQEPCPLDLAGMFPIRQPARPKSPPKPENRPEGAAMGMDRFDTLR